MARGMPETASARESRLAQDRQREEESPTLIGQLKLIREAWGEGFDEDIAKPLAAVLATVRKQMEAAAKDAEQNLDHLQTQLDDFEMAAQDNADAADELRELRDDLADVPRGVRTLDEVMEKHEAVT